MQKQAESEAEKIADRCYNELAQTCEKSFWELCCSRSGQAVRALLSNDLPEVVIETCIQIVTREAAERVRRWTQSHITLGRYKNIKKLKELGIKGLRLSFHAPRDFTVITQSHFSFSSYDL